MNKQLVGLVLTIVILPISIAGCQSSRFKQPQTTANANATQVNIGENDQSSFVWRMQKREEDRQQAIATLQSGSPIDRVVTRKAPEVQTPKSDKIDRVTRANRHVN